MSVAKQVCVGVLYSRVFFARHRVAAEEFGAAQKILVRHLADRGFGASRVRYQCAGLGSFGNYGQRLDRGANRQSNVNEVGAANSAGKVCGGFVHDAASTSTFESVRTVIANCRDLGEVLPQGERE